MSVSRAASLNQPNYVLRALRAPSIVPSIQLSPAEAAHMSDPRAETAEPDCALKSCPTVEPATWQQTKRGVIVAQRAMALSPPEWQTNVNE